MRTGLVTAIRAHDSMMIEMVLLYGEAYAFPSSFFICRWWITRRIVIIVAKMIFRKDVMAANRGRQ